MTRTSCVGLRASLFVRIIAERDACSACPSGAALMSWDVPTLKPSRTRDDQDFSFIA